MKTFGECKVGDRIVEFDVCDFDPNRIRTKEIAIVCDTPHLYFYYSDRDCSYNLPASKCYCINGRDVICPLENGDDIVRLLTTCKEYATKDIQWKMRCLLGINE